MNIKNKIVKNLQDLVYDPTAIQSHILNQIGLSVETQNVDIPDPTNPFIYLLESNALLTVATLNEFSLHTRKLYPILAEEKSELYHHLAMNETNDIFTSASKADFTFYIDKKVFLDNGYKENNYTEIIIPRFTTITINDIVFTLLNDIHVKQYNSGGLFIKQKGSSEILSNPKDVVLTSGIVTDDNHVEWIIFDVTLDQIDVLNVKDNLIKSSGYQKDIPIDDYYVDIDVRSIFKNGLVKKLNTTYSNFVYDPEYPTAYIKPLENKVSVNIPILYLHNNSVNDYVDIKLFTSKGIISEPLDKYSVDNFKITYYNIGDRPQTEALNVITMYTKATSRTYGGRNELGFRELKDKIIKHTTGDNIIPITDNEIAEEASKLNFNIRLDKDSLLHREYVVSTEFDNLEHDVSVLADIFMDKLSIDYRDIDDTYIKKYGKSIIINPFTIFQLDENSKQFRPLGKNKILGLQNSAKEDLIVDLNKNRYFYNIHKYILDYENELLVRAYDLNKPEVVNIKDNINNNKLGSTLNITNREVKRVKDSFIYTFDILSDNKFKDINTDMLKIELSIHKKHSSTGIYYYGDVYKEDNVIKGKIVIDTTGYIDKDNKIFLNNFVSNVDIINVNLDVDITMYIYSKDDNLTSFKTSLTEMLNDKDNSVALYMENSKLIFGKYLKYLYTNYTTTYTDRKYKRYEDDVILRYTENVYKTDEYGVVIDYNTNEPIILHPKGEIVLDNNNQPIIKHRKGEVMLDENNNPIIDDKYGIKHYMDILLLEYQYLASTNPTTKTYIEDVYKRITDISTKELKGLNSRLLDNTIIKYKPLNNLRDVQLYLNNVIYLSKNFVNPKVILYVFRDDISLSEYEKYLNIIGINIQYGLRKRERISILEENIKNIIGDNGVSIKITNLDTVSELDIKQYSKDSSNIVLNKQLRLDELGTTTVKHTIEIQFIKVN